MDAGLTFSPASGLTLISTVCWFNRQPGVKRGKMRPNGPFQAEDRMKPVAGRIAGYLVRYQKELILLVFCG
jgi:hypothetical protein